MDAPPLMWETVEVFPNRSMAEIGVSALASAGIATRIVADDAEGVGLPLGFSGGAELQVPTGDMADAREILFGKNVINENVFGDGVQAPPPPSPPSERMISLGASTAGVVVALVLVLALLIAFFVNLI